LSDIVHYNLVLKKGNTTGKGNDTLIGFTGNYRPSTTISAAIRYEGTVRPMIHYDKY